MRCRHCTNELKHELIDLGAQPPSNSYLKAGDLDKAEQYFPLKVYFCSSCYLFQTADVTQKETFFNEDYAYFSSVSQTYLTHAWTYVNDMINHYDITTSSFVIEVASNDGYLLKNFLGKKIPCLGIEPTKSTAQKSAALGINTLIEFYGTETALHVYEQCGAADLIICNNVYGHVPDINDFTQALAISVGENGVITMEFPHLLNLIALCQFDTIYHEHFSYLSITTVQQIFSENNLRIFNVEELSTHGGSLRIHGCKDTADFERSASVDEIIQREIDSGMFDSKGLERFSRKANNIKINFLEFLLKAKKEGKTVCGYGAAAKGNTLINYAGVKPDLLQCVGDAAPSKIGKFLPGSRIPVVNPKYVEYLEPDYVVILPWNIADEVKSQCAALVKTGCKFVTFIPRFRVI